MIEVERPVVEVYAIRVDGSLGPLMLSCLPHHLSVCTAQESSVIVSIPDDDLVTVAERIIGYGLEIHHVRDLGLAS